MMHPWLFVELGGSSAQTAQRDTRGRFWFTPGVVHDPERPVALACPGVIRDRRVLYATNLGWPDDAVPGRELGVQQLRIVMNDAEAAALGESILRSSKGTLPDLVYVTLGTGLGIARVRGGVPIDPDVAHYPAGGDNYCTGCRNTGCLNSLVCSQNLPGDLTTEVQVFVAQTLASALGEVGLAKEPLLVVAGGMARRYPRIVSVLDSLLPNAVGPTAAPPEAKSAAYAGLHYRVTRQTR